MNPEQLAFQTTLVALIAIAVPLATGLVIAPFAHRWRRFAAILASLASLCALGAQLLLLAQAHGRGTGLLAHIPTAHFLPAGLYRVDMLGLLFGSSVSFAASIAFLYSALSPEQPRRFLSVPATLALLSAALSLFYSTNLFAIYASWEASAIAAACIGSPPGRRNLLISWGTAHLLGYPLLAMALWFAHASGNLQYDGQHIRGYIGAAPFVLALVAAIGRTGLFPFYRRIQSYLESSDTASRAVLAAAYFPQGIYLIARLYSIGRWTVNQGIVLSVAACVGLLVAALLSLASGSPRQGIYQFVAAQYGIALLGLATTTPNGSAGALVHFIAIAVAVPLLLLPVSTARVRLRLASLLGIAAMAGLPLLPGFAGLWVISQQYLQKNEPAVAAAALAGSALSTVGAIRAVAGWSGSPRSGATKPRGIGSILQAALLVVVSGVAIGLGTAAWVELKAAVELAIEAMGPGMTPLRNLVPVEWLGLRMTVGDQIVYWPPIAMASMVAVTALAAHLLFRLRRASVKPAPAYAGGARNGYDCLPVASGAGAPGSQDNIAGIGSPRASEAITAVGGARSGNDFDNG